MSFHVTIKKLKSNKIVLKYRQKKIKEGKNINSFMVRLWENQVVSLMTKCINYLNKRNIQNALWQCYTSSYLCLDTVKKDILLAHVIIGGV